MALFKSEEEKRLFEEKLKKEKMELKEREEKRKKEQREFEERILIMRQERVQKLEDKLLKDRIFKGKVGSTHTGWTFRDGLRNADKTKFKKTKFQIFDDKLIIERNRYVVHFSDVKEIFYDGKSEALIILDNGKVIPIRKSNDEELEAFVNILNNFIDENKSNANSIKSNDNNKVNSQEKSEDKFDKLIKLGEMHDKGLLSDEEFVSLKQELLSGANENTINSDEDDVEPSENTCENCGSDISPDDVFCCECGTQINNN